jgi:hypothetical protein
MVVKITNKEQFNNWLINPTGTHYYQPEHFWAVPVEIVKYGKEIEINGIRQEKYYNRLKYLDTVDDAVIPISVLDNNTIRDIEKEWPEMFL